MIDLALLATAALMGLGGAWHCALMCGPLCAAHAGTGWMVGRTVGYAAVGAALAGASSWGSGFVLRGAAGAWSPWLTLWALAHAAALSLGLFLLWQGRQPAWLARWAMADRAPAAVVRWVPLASPAASTGTSAAAPQAAPVSTSVTRPAPLLLGLAWALLPCGLLQSAWVVAALSSHAAGGAAVMLVFSLCSAPGLLAAPLLGAAWHRRRDDPSWRSRLVIMTTCQACCWPWLRLGPWGMVFGHRFSMCAEASVLCRSLA
ncbi:MAG: sulfite exporter TauE/SafE family protein [Betaproteobacteria bacterium]